ncbi:hypothetical protein DSECCO2_545430 [anaerobic digester metagenome]
MQPTNRKCAVVFDIRIPCIFWNALMLISLRTYGSIAVPFPLKPASANPSSPSTMIGSDR